MGRYPWDAHSSTPSRPAARAWPATSSWCATISSISCAAERARLDLEALTRNGRGSDCGRARRQVDLLAAAVEELHEQAPAARVHGVRDARQALDDARVVAGDRVTRQQAARVHGSGLDADQPSAALGPRRVVGDEVVGGQAVLDERRLVGRRDDAIAELDRPDLQGAQQQRVGHSGRGYVRLRARRRAAARAAGASRASCAREL